MTDTVLALDCSGPWVGLALRVNGRVATRFEGMQRGQAEHLLEAAQGLLEDHGRGFGDLSALAVGRGPGNFTGLRIAIAAARGLALGLGCPCLGITGFEAIAARHGRAGLAVIEAPREQAYVQDFTAATAPALWTKAAVSQCPTPRLPDLAAEDIAPMILQVAVAHLAEGGELPRPVPLYLRPADAAPAAPGPVLLP